MKEQEYPRVAAYVLFTDVEKFTTRDADVQVEIVEKLEALLISCESIASKNRPDDYLLLPTGDGYAVAFLNDPEAPLLTALELTEKLNNEDFKCYMGINTGLVYLKEDLNLNPNLLGGGINFAQRVMSLGSGGHILASKEAVEWLKQTTRKHDGLFHYIGHYSPKPDVVIEIYNVYNNSIGNEATPVKCRLISTSRRLYGPEDPLISRDKDLLGREKEISDITSMLEQGESLGVVVASELVASITGSPGIGKTELCKAALKKWLSGADGRSAWYVGLSGANGFSEFISRLAEAYRVDESAGPDGLLHAMNNNPGVLYLDNLEDVLDADEAVDFLDRIKDTQGVRVLASSREVLEGRGKTIHLEALPLKEAVKLFIDRWQDAGVKAKDSKALREFVKEDLGCHPLSIELVAAQASQYPSIEEIRKAWHKKGTSLAQMHRGTKDRHTSLDVSISLSLEGVKKQEGGDTSLVLWGLMVFFPEGMSDTAWEFISKSAGISTDARSLLIRLSLIDFKDGKLSMLPPLRRFAEERAVNKSEDFDIDKLIDAAYPYFLHVAKQASDHQFDDEHIKTLDALLLEFSNIHRFVVLSSDKGKARSEKLSELSYALYDFYQLRIFSGLDMLKSILPLQMGAGLKLQTARSLNVLADLEWRLGRINEAKERYKKAIRIFTDEKHNFGLANALRSLADLDWRLGRINEAKEGYKKAIRIFTDGKHNLGLANTIKGLADLECALGHNVEAEEDYKKAIKIFTDVKANLSLASALFRLANLKFQLGRIPEAVDDYRNAIKLYKDEKSNIGLANALRAYGNLYLKLKDYSRAESLYEEAKSLYVSERSNMGLAYTCAELAMVCHATNRPDEQDSYLKEAFAAAEKSNVPAAKDYVKKIEAELRGDG